MTGSMMESTLTPPITGHFCTRGLGRECLVGSGDGAVRRTLAMSHWMAVGIIPKTRPRGTQMYGPSGP